VLPTGHLLVMLRSAAHVPLGLRVCGAGAILRGTKSSSVLKATPLVYYNWVGSNWSLKGVAEYVQILVGLSFVV
jgi:hypothetical protein